MIAQTDQLESTAEAEVRPTAAVASSPADARLDELAEIIRAYNRATDNLQRSHEALRQQVVRLQEQLASADAQLQRSKRLAALGEMAAGIAHEIRNPLAAIQLYVGMLAEDLGRLRHQSSRRADGPQFPLPSEGEGGGDPFRSPSGEGSGAFGLPDEKTLTPALSLGHRRESGSDNAAETLIVTDCLETAGKIRSAVHGLDGIVNDVLSFARELAPHRSRVSVESLFERALDSQRPAIEAAGVKGHQRCVPPDLAVLADSDLLQQALLNLLRNAVQAVTEPPARKRSATITLAARHEDGLVTLTVRDNGPGIAPEHIERIFNPFFTTRSTGTGLGLAIVHRIVDAHGGTISVHNDGGAVFELRLPQSKEFTTETTEGTEKQEEESATDEHR